MIKQASLAAMALGLAVVSASGDTISLQFQSIAGGSSANKVVVGGQALTAGHIVHTIASGSQAGSEFRTFCIELGQNVGSGTTVYDIVALTEAPVPGTKYTTGQANMISAVVANAMMLGWIDSKLQADDSQSDYLARMGAIQAAIWEAVGGAVDINASGTSASLRAAYNVLMDAQSFDSSLRMSGLRALTNQTRQDQLIVVPLPPAAFAGMGMLAVGFGVRAVRRRG